MSRATLMAMIVCPIECQKFGSTSGTSFASSTSGHVDRLEAQSRYFPAIDRQALVDRCLQLACERNTSAAIRALR